MRKLVYGILGAFIMTALIMGSIAISTNDPPAPQEPIHYASVEDQPSKAIKGYALVDAGDHLSIEILRNSFVETYRMDKNTIPEDLTLQGIKPDIFVGIELEALSHVGNDPGGFYLLKFKPIPAKSNVKGLLAQLE